MDAPPLDSLPPDARKARHWALEKLIAEAGLLPSGLVAAESWRQEFSALRRQRLSEPRPPADLPLIVLDRSEGTDEVHDARQAQLASLSSRGKLIRVERSGHMIHLYRPEVVVQAIEDVVAASRSGK